MAKKSRVLNLRENEEYYSLAKEGSLDTSHPWAKVLEKHARNAANILDIGCGEGTRLANVLKTGQSGTGVDISSKAISLAREQYPEINFLQTNEDVLPFNQGQFDLAYSAFVLEHTTNPEKFLNEAIRVLRKGGLLILVAPNFGAPNRRSPNSNENALQKLVTGLLKDTKLLPSGSATKLSWKSVEPKSDTYTMDSDTTIEPYLLTLKKFLQNSGLQIETHTSCWPQDTLSLSQIVFRGLGILGIYPFKYWGPHLVIVGRKV